MKKIIIALILCFVSITTFAYEWPNGLVLGGDAEVNANYLWRGQHLGGLSFQPEITFGYYGETTNEAVQGISLSA